MSGIQGQLQVMDTRITGLRELIARRQAQSGAVDTFEKDCAGHAVRNNETHIFAAQKELRDVALEYVRLKCVVGHWDPSEVIERMKGPRHDTRASPASNQGA
jgi:hypothetical protein